MNKSIEKDKNKVASLRAKANEIEKKIKEKEKRQKEILYQKNAKRCVDLVLEIEQKLNITLTKENVDFLTDKILAQENPKKGLFIVFGIEEPEDNSVENVVEPDIYPNEEDIPQSEITNQQ